MLSWTGAAKEDQVINMEENGPVEDPGLPRNGDSLFVFGYEAKIFRDDEKAKWIEKGSHLIPWMGDPSLMIDRYDVRAALSDLSKYEVPSTPRLPLTPEESKLEADIDLERYKDLREDDEELYQGKK